MTQKQSYVDVVVRHSGRKTHEFTLTVEDAIGHLIGKSNISTAKAMVLRKELVDEAGYGGSPVSIPTLALGVTVRAIPTRVVPGRGDTYTRNLIIYRMAVTGRFV